MLRRCVKPEKKRGGERMRNRRSWGGSFALICVAAVVVGCGSSSSSSTTTPAATSTGAAPATSGANASVVALVPAAIKSKGTLTVAADASYAPNEFIGPDGHTVIGMDVDFIKAVAAVMGLKANVVNATFDTILPGLASGKYDIGVSSMTDTKTREKTVDFVDYYVAGESFFTKAQGGTTIGSIADICGHTVAVEKGTTELADAQTQSAKCTKAGKKGVTVLPFPDQNGANLALTSGRAQLVFVDSPVAAYQIKQASGQFKIVGAPYANAPYGIPIPKTSHLTKAIQAAVQAVMANGQYLTILTKWGVQGGAIHSAAVNGAVS
jgi:polar amino acid transport system substrate-binding protein